MRWIALPQSSWCAGWSRFRRCRVTKPRRRRGSSSRCARAGYDRAFVDDAGNAVGELGDPSAVAHDRASRPHRHRPRQHSGPHRAVGADGDLLFGRGSVDAKGPLATFRRRRRAVWISRRRERPASVWSSSARSKKRPPPARARGSSRRASTARPSRFPPPASSASRATGIASRSATRDGCCSTSPPISRWPTPPARMPASRRWSSTYWNWVTAHAAALQRRQGQGLRSAEPEPAPLHHVHERRDARPGRCAVCVAAAGRLRRGRDSWRACRTQWPAAISPEANDSSTSSFAGRRTRLARRSQ